MLVFEDVGQAGLAGEGDGDLRPDKGDLEGYHWQGDVKASHNAGHGARHVAHHYSITARLCRLDIGQGKGGVGGAGNTAAVREV